MKRDIKIPAVGESVKEAILVQWYKADGDLVQKDEPLFLIETDKITLEVAAETDGILSIGVPEGRTVAIGAVVGAIETTAKVTKPAAAPPAEPKAPAPAEKAQASLKQTAPDAKTLSPAVRRLVSEKNIDISALAGSGPDGRITKGDVLIYLEQDAPHTRPAGRAPAEEVPPAAAAPASLKTPAFGETTRTPMSPIRRRIAARLLEARQNTAMLTTFNEIDMSRVIKIRQKHKEAFRGKHDVSLGFMSFFVRASVSALKAFPEINASVEGDEIVHHHYYHIGVAIGTERGLLVPVIRNADRLGFAAIEKCIVDYVTRIQKNRLALADLEGGTFTISNGGVYGSLLSTPILNIPQSGILGMHKIEDRPVAGGGRVVIRPMMYVALSYDHRMVDGKGAVGFLKHIKEWIEAPEDPMAET